VLVCVPLCALVFVVVFVFAEVPVSVKKKEEKGGRTEKKEETGGWGVFKKNTLKRKPNAFEMREVRKWMMIEREEKAKEDCKRKKWRERTKNDESKDTNSKRAKSRSMDRRVVST
jgi:hypothetical protein